jgi:hypothetical protein
MVDILLSKDSDELIELKNFSWERVDWQTKNSSTTSLSMILEAWCLNR